MNPTGKGGHREIRIIKGAKVPPTRPPLGSRSRYPFLDMEIGDSFVVEEKNAESARAIAYKIAKRYGVKFVGRKMKDGSVQFWRVAL